MKSIPSVFTESEFPHLSSEDKRFIATLRELLAAGSPSGREERLSGVVAGRLESLGYKYEEDPARNLVVRLPGRNKDAPPVMLAAHMDEIGVVVTAVNADGTLKVDRSGGLAPFKLGETPLQFFGDRRTICGVLSFGSGHTASHGGGPEWKDVCVITGLTSAELHDAGVRPGTSGVPLAEGRGPVLFGSPGRCLLGAWTLDDRGGVAILLEVLRHLKESGGQPAHPLTVAFTVHEEGGCLGAAVLAARERPEVFIAVDGSPWKEGDGFSVSDRPVAWSKDALAHYDQRLLADISSACERADTSLQYAVLKIGYSDASSVYKTGASPRVGLLGYARYNSHGFEVAELAAFQNVIRSLREFLSMPLA